MENTNLNTVKVKRDKLLATLKENLGKHSVEYTQAIKDWQDKNLRKALLNL